MNQYFVASINSSLCFYRNGIPVVQGWWEKEKQEIKT